MSNVTPVTSNAIWNPSPHGLFLRNFPTHIVLLPIMKKFYALLLVAFSFCLFSTTSQASHIVGGQIEYECVGGDSLLVHLYLYRDCSGITMPTTNLINGTSSCGGTATATLNIVLDSLGNQWADAGSICGPDSLNSTCFGGTLPGMRVYHYSGYLVLTPPCDTWTISWTTCCRNVSVNIPASNGDNIYIETTVNTVTAPCDNSPSVLQNRIAYLCINQQQTVNYTAFDVDGDSLVYTFVSALAGVGIPLAYGGGYSGGAPLVGIVIDPATGIATVTPTTVGNFIVVVLIESYDSNGNLVGTILVDTQIIVFACANNVSSLSGGITNLTGAATLFDSTTIDACGGSSFCFDYQVSDLDPNDTLTLVNNLQNYWPGAVITLAGTNPLDINVCWTAPASGGNHYLPMQVRDNACPIAGNNTHMILLRALEGTSAGPDAISCAGDPAQLNAEGGSAFVWTVISGDPIAVGVNFSCDTCTAPVASPAVTTTYLVTSNLSGACSNTDTVTVVVDPGFTIAVTDTGFSSGPCAYDSLQLLVTPSVAGSYTYSWSPAGDVSDPSIGNPILLLDQYGAYNLAVTTTSAIGCTQTDSFYYFSNNPILVVSASDTILCSGGSIELLAGSASSGGSACGTAFDPCFGTPNVGTIGAGSTVNTTSTWPAPYGNWYRNAKHQFLFTAAELNAMGLVAGNINDVSWEVTAINGATDYFDYKLRMGCTSASDLVTWETGLSTVMAPQDITIVQGWNTHVFDAAYQWDGVSNIVLEICYDNLGLGYTNNSITPQDPTAHVSSLVYYSDASPACPYSATSIPYNARPVTRFGWCGLSINENDYDVHWTPSAGIANPTSSATMANATQTTWYVVTATDTATGCIYTDSVLVTVGGSFAVTASVSDSVICLGDTITLSATTSGNSSHSWSPAASIFDPTSGTTMATPTQTTSYTVAVIDTVTGCSSSDAVLVTVSSFSSVSASVSDNLICIGDTITLVAAGSGVSYSWSPSAELFNPTSGTTDGTPSTATTFTVVATDSIGCTGTTSVFVDVYPVFSTGAIAGSQVVGELTTEAYSVTGGGGSTFVWTVAGGTIVSGQGTDNIVIDWGSNGVGSLTVVETNQDGCLGLPAILSIDIVTGIDDSFAPAMFNFDVHPNPAKAQATLTVVGLTNYQFEILDVTGKLIRKVENIGEPQFAFDVHDLTKGVYFIRVTSGDAQHSETKRLVIL
jgi:hypothetical protein